MYLLTQRNTDFKLHSIWPRHLLRSVLGDCESFYFNGYLPLRHPEVIPWRKEGDIHGTCNSGGDKTRDGKVLVWPFGHHTCDIFHRRPWTQETSVFFLSAFIVFVSFYFVLGHFQQQSVQPQSHGAQPQAKWALPSTNTTQQGCVSDVLYSNEFSLFRTHGDISIIKVTGYTFEPSPSFSPLPTIHQEHLGRSPTSRLSDSSSPTVSTVPSSCHSPPPIIPGNVIYREGERESHQHSYKTLLLL